MAFSHLLDTSVYCQPLKPRPLPSVRGRWEALGDEVLAISVVCEAELFYGLELKQSANLVAKYDALLKNRLHTFPVDVKIAATFGQTKAAARKSGHACPDFDILIAATAKVHGLILATLNYRHFAGIEGLALEDWSRD